MDQGDNDEALMLKYRRGDANAFEILYRRHRGGVYRYILRQCRSRVIADELFQDVWMNVINARHRYKAAAKFTTWLYCIAHNRMVDHLRRQTASNSMNAANDDVRDPDEIPAPAQSQPERKAELERTGARLLLLIDQLPAEQRQVFLLREEAGMSIVEIAETLGVKPETAKSRLRYAVNKLRSGMSDSI